MRSPANFRLRAGASGQEVLVCIVTAVFEYDLALSLIKQISLGLIPKATLEPAGVGWGADYLIYDITVD